MAEQRSREHLKTAKKLAKLEEKERRRRDRRRRRLRRRLKAVNVVLALIRAVLAAVVVWIVLTVSITAASGTPPDQFGDAARGAIGLATLVALFLGPAWFPWPRSFDTDSI